MKRKKHKFAAVYFYGENLWTTVKDPEKYSISEFGAIELKYPTGNFTAGILSTFGKCS